MQRLIRCVFAACVLGVATIPPAIGQESPDSLYYARRIPNFNDYGPPIGFTHYFQDWPSISAGYAGGGEYRGFVEFSISDITSGILGFQYFDREGGPTHIVCDGPLGGCRVVSDPFVGVVDVLTYSPGTRVFDPVFLGAAETFDPNSPHGFGEGSNNPSYFIDVSDQIAQARSHGLLSIGFAFLASGPSFNAGDYALVDLTGFTLAAAPVPEPDAFALVLAGLGCLSAVRRRRAAGASTAAASL